jgi:hypothetical protein
MRRGKDDRTGPAVGPGQDKGFGFVFRQMRHPVLTLV